MFSWTTSPDIPVFLDLRAETPGHRRRHHGNMCRNHMSVDPPSWGVMQMFRSLVMAMRRVNAVNQGEDEHWVEEFQGGRSGMVQVRVFLVARFVVGGLA